MSKKIYPVDYAGYISFQHEPKYGEKDLLDAEQNPDYLKLANEIAEAYNNKIDLSSKIEEVREKVSDEEILKMYPKFDSATGFPKPTNEKRRKVAREIRDLIISSLEGENK